MRESYQWACTMRSEICDGNLKIAASIWLKSGAGRTLAPFKKLVGLGIAESSLGRLPVAA
jgi:hypothetical protein